MVEEVFGVSDSGLKAAGMNQAERDAFWDQMEQDAALEAAHEAKLQPFMVSDGSVEVPDVKSKKDLSNVPQRVKDRLDRENIFDTEDLTTNELDQMVKEVFGTTSENLAAAGMSAEEQEAFWEREAYRSELRAAHDAKHPAFMVDSGAVDVPETSSQSSEGMLTPEEEAELIAAAQAIENGEVTLEELYAREPSKFKKWARYIVHSLGYGAAVFSDGFWNLVDHTFIKPLYDAGLTYNRLSGDVMMGDYPAEQKARADAAAAAMGDSTGWKLGEEILTSTAVTVPTVMSVLAALELLAQRMGTSLKNPGSLRDYKIPMLDFPELDTEQADVLSYVPEYLDVQDGLVGGKVPLDVYSEMRAGSVHNVQADSILLGKFRPAVENGVVDWTIPGPDSYNVLAGNEYMYFDMGSENWTMMTDNYDLSDDEMFEYFNKPFVENAIKEGKEIVMSHNPLDFPGSFLADEWTLIKEMLNLDDSALVRKGDFWYVKLEW